MLNRTLLLQELQSFSGQLFGQRHDNAAYLHHGWMQVIASQAMLADEIKRRHMHVALPLWAEHLGECHAIGCKPHQYAILGVDGSQIYPDRHRGRLNCFMINIGSVLLAYGEHTSSVALSSVPRLFTNMQELNEEHDEALTRDTVDLQREELEFAQGFEQACLYVQQSEAIQPFLCVFDGSFIFWHLESKPTEIKERFLSLYLASLQDFADHAIMVASYISMPRNRELTNLVALALCPQFKKMGKMCTEGDCACLVLRTTVDSDIVGLFLQPGERTTVFVSTSYVTREYPANLVPCFFFMHVGAEIVRVELPQWVVHKPGAVDTIAALLYDQAIKGAGYPVVLAEAHEQAVVKGSEQDFFYEVLAHKAQAQGIRLQPSQKSLKKKIMSI